MLGARLPREAWRVRGRIGYVGHEPLLYRDLTVGENLRFHARLHGLEAPDRRIAELLDRVGMARREDEVVGNLSAGMAQRVAVCRAVLHEPELMLLDEPLAHLDPEASTLVDPLIGRRPAAPGSRSRTTSAPASPRRARAGARARRHRRLCGARVGSLARKRPRRSTGGRHGEGLRRDPRQGSAGRAAHASVGPGDGAVRRQRVRAGSGSGSIAPRSTGSLAAGVLLATLLFAAILAVNRCSSPSATREGSTRSGWRPSTARRCSRPRRRRWSSTWSCSRAVTVPVFAIFFLDDWVALLRWPRAAARRSRPRGDRRADLLVATDLAPGT